MGSTHPQLIDDELHVAAYVQDGDPGAVGAGMYWQLESTPFTLKKRNAADSGWDTVSATADTHAHAPADMFDYSVRAATAVALAGSPTYANGTAGVGATLTRTGNGALAAQDGVTLVNGNTFCVKNQSAGLQNGLYLVTDVGSAGTPYILTRDPLSDTAAELANGLRIFVQEGTTNGDTGWLLTTNNPITVGTTSLTFVQNTLNGVPNGDGLGIERVGLVFGLKLKPFYLKTAPYTTTLADNGFCFWADPVTYTNNLDFTLPTGSTYDGVEYTFVLATTDVNVWTMSVIANAADTIGFTAVPSWGTTGVGDLIHLKYRFATNNWVVLYVGNPGI